MCQTGKRIEQLLLWYSCRSVYDDSLWLLSLLPSRVIFVRTTESLSSGWRKFLFGTPMIIRCIADGLIWLYSFCPYYWKVSRQFYMPFSQFLWTLRLISRMQISLLGKWDTMNQKRLRWIRRWGILARYSIFKCASPGFTGTIARHQNTQNRIDHNGFCSRSGWWHWKSLAALATPSPHLSLSLSGLR